MSLWCAFCSPCFHMAVFSCGCLAPNHLCRLQNWFSTGVIYSSTSFTWENLGRTLGEPWENPGRASAQSCSSTAFIKVCKCYVLLLWVQTALWSLVLRLFRSDECIRTGWWPKLEEIWFLAVFQTLMSHCYFLWQPTDNIILTAGP